MPGENEPKVYKDRIFLFFLAGLVAGEVVARIVAGLGLLSNGSMQVSQMNDLFWALCGSLMGWTVGILHRIRYQR